MLNKKYRWRHLFVSLCVFNWVVCCLSLITITTYAAAPSFSISVENIPLTDAILMLAKLTHRNVMISPLVSGTTTLHFKKVDPATVFDSLLHAHQLAKMKIENVYYIAPVDELLKQQQNRLNLMQLQQKSAVVNTVVQQIKYTSAQNIAAIIKDDHATFISERGSVKVDSRTNSLAIQDVAERLLAIKKLIVLLDVPVQQILIEARIASVDSDCEKELGLRFDAYPSTDQARTSARMGHYSLAVAHLADGSVIDFKLALLEKAGHAELISSPSLATTNQEPALLEAGEEVPYQEVSESGGTAVTFKKAVLGLKVTPEVLPHNNILLKLQINQDRPSNKLIQGVPTINTRKIVTNVLSQMGKTIVLGGIYESNRDEGQVGIPYLQRIPLLGWLFRTKNVAVTKRELLIFVTPKLIRRLTQINK